MESSDEAIAGVCSGLASLKEIQTAYNTTAQASEYYLSLTSEQLNNLKENGEITAKKIKEMANQDERLSMVLKNTEVSTSTLAVYYQKLDEGLLNAKNTAEDFVVTLDKVMAAQNAVNDSFEFIDNFAVFF